MWCANCNTNKCELHSFYQQLEILSLNKENNDSTFNRICVNNVFKKFLSQANKI